jgi:hypothetical protein
MATNAFSTRSFLLTCRQTRYAILATMLSIGQLTPCSDEDSVTRKKNAYMFISLIFPLVLMLE